MNKIETKVRGNGVESNLGATIGRKYILFFYFFKMVDVELGCRAGGAPTVVVLAISS